MASVSDGRPPPRFFVILLGRGTDHETLDYLEATHGKYLAGKLHSSLCGKHIYGVVEIDPSVRVPVEES